MPIERRTVLGAIAALPLIGFGGCASLPAAPATRSSRFTLTGANARTISVWEWMPKRATVGTVLFSHGAGSAPDKYPAITGAWVAAGWRVLAPLHVDSREHPRTADYPGLASWSTRLEDMALLADHAQVDRFVAAGHSYGGLVALTLGGAAAMVPEGYNAPLADPRTSAVVAFSPPAPIPALITAEAYAALGVPALIQTGTRDIVPGITSENGEGWRGHLAPYEAPRAGGTRYGLVLEGVDHYFGGAICDFTRPGPPQLERLADAVNISTLFIQAHGLDSSDALARLQARLSAQFPIMLMRR